MISRELAKELKKVGYPQELKWGDWVYHKHYPKGKILVRKNPEYEIDEWNKEDYIKIPVLSELIKATKQKGREIELNECREEKDHIWNEEKREFEKDKKGKFIIGITTEYHWEAIMNDWGKKYGGRSCFETGDEVVTWTKGKSPEEAMSKLYIKLNEKKKE